MIEKVRIGIIGLGIMGEQYARIYQAHPLAEVTAICNHRRKRLDEIGEKYRIESRYTGFAEMLTHAPIDAVCVWAGDVEIALKIEQGSQAAVAALHTMLEPKKTEWNGYTVSLVTLTPVRMASTPVDPAAYRAELLVTR